jgi:hypothetical protein
MLGSSADCVSSYMAAGTDNVGDLEAEVAHLRRPLGQGDVFRFERVVLKASQGNSHLRVGEPFRLRIEFSTTELITDVGIGFSLDTHDGTRILQSGSTHHRPPYRRIAPGHYSVEISCENPLTPGRYVLGIGSRSASRALDVVPEILTVEVASDAPVDDWLAPNSGLVRAQATYGDPEPARWVSAHN